MKKPTALEKITDNPITQGGLAAFSAFFGTPLAALPPVLANTLAAGRFQERVTQALAQIESTLEEHHHQLDALTDPQFKLMNEIVLAVLQNTEDAKIEYLRRAILGSLEYVEISHTIAAQVARALRDMTADELAFVVKHSEKAIMFGPVSGEQDPDITVIGQASDEMVYVSGLMGLGVLIPAGSTIGDGGKYVFAKFCGALKALIVQDGLTNCST